ncbi:MAG: DNA polymerase III subunit alpha [Actinomycetota bacterium]|nr:DNA polymerase III subunit alpha [Actinomycetota bacterium]
MALQWPHLRVASSYSMRYGTATPHRIIERAAADGHRIIALTDRDGISGAVQWVRACMSAGIAPVVGVDLAVIPTVVDASVTHVPRGSTRQRAYAVEELPRVVFLALGSIAGWASLCQLISAAHANVQKYSTPVLEAADVLAHHSGVVTLLGPDSELGSHLLHGRLRAAEQTLLHWRSITGSGLAIAIGNHRRPRGQAWSALHAARMWEWGRAHGARVIFTSNARYLDAHDARTADILDATRRMTRVKSLRLLMNNGQATLDSPADLDIRVQEVAQLVGIAPALMHRDTWLLMEACALDPARDIGLGSVFVPEFDVITGASASDDVAAAQSLLTARCQQSIPSRYPSTADHSRARLRLDEELQAIQTLGFAGYFLTVAEVVDLIRERGVRVAARGSGAGSLVTYLLGINDVDPLAHNLVFERFLSTLRTELPDIDIDVESARRLEVYDLIYERFGASRVACVSMMETYKVRQAIRDVGAALGMDASDIDNFAKSFPHIRARNARSALADLPELQSSQLGVLVAQGRLDGFLDRVEALDGLPRLMALHPCGVLLSDTSLLERTPIQSSAAGYPMSQFDKDDVEHMGLLKLDVLGVRMQSSIAFALDEIARTQEVAVDLSTVPLDDPATFALIQSTRTLGCFQIESPGQRELIGKFAPETFNDLIIDISLFRPGPVKSDMITPFLKSRHGWDLPHFIHPDLQPILQETEGVVIFHEQVMRIVEVMTGCSLAEADEIRRAMSTTEAIDATRVWFYPKALQRGYSLATVEEIWEVLKSFASFGFCKAHAAAFALPTYQSAWLKTHYPAAFYAGILTHDPGMYPKRLLLADARNFGIQILGLHINISSDSYQVERTPQGEGVRMPFTEVKGISEDEVARLIHGQPYSGLSDAWQRGGISRPILEHLVLLGAFDALYGININHLTRPSTQVSRRDLLVHIEQMARHPVHVSSGQLCLDTAGDISDVPVSGWPEITPNWAVRTELELLGLDVTKHVMDSYRALLTELGVTPAADLLTCHSEQEVLIAGVKVATQTPAVRGGKRVVFLTLDDGTGPSDATFFSDAQTPYANTVFQSWMLVVRGHVRRTGARGVSIRATGAWELGALDRQWRTGGIDQIRERLMHERAVPVEQRSGRPHVFPTGYQLSPYADVQPAGPTGKLYHSSQGSSGR